MLKRVDLKGSFHVALVDSESGGRKYKKKISTPTLGLCNLIRNTVRSELCRDGSETGWNKGGRWGGGGGTFPRNFSVAPK